MRRYQVTAVLMLGTLAIFLTGCSRNPVSPDLTSPAQGGASEMGVEIHDTPTEVEGGVPAAVTAIFAADEAGRITVGRWTLDLHKNSLKMPATITLRVDNQDALDVHVEIVPAEAANFRVPAELSASLADLPQTNYETMWMWYLENGDWDECADVAQHPNQQNVVARIDHLTSFRVGDHVVPDDIKGRK